MHQSPASQTTPLSPPPGAPGLRATWIDFFCCTTASPDSSIWRGPNGPQTYQSEEPAPSHHHHLFALTILFQSLLIHEAPAGSSSKCFPFPRHSDVPPSPTIVLHLKPSPSFLGHRHHHHMCPRSPGHFFRIGPVQLGIHEFMPRKSLSFACFRIPSAV